MGGNKKSLARNVTTIYDVLRQLATFVPFWFSLAEGWEAFSERATRSTSVRNLLIPIDMRANPD